jgi:hypothetical protein
MTESRRSKWVGQAVCMGYKSDIKCWKETSKDRQNKSVDKGIIILKKHVEMVWAADTCLRIGTNGGLL